MQIRMLLTSSASVPGNVLAERYSIRRVFTQILPMLALLLASSPSVSQTPDVDRLIDEFRTAEYFWQQHDIARELIAAGDRSAITEIQPYLTTRDRRRRCNAAFVLAGLGDERGVEILISELQDTEAGSRVLMAEGPTSGTPRALAMQQVRSDRYFAALLLGELRERVAVPALIAATRDESINGRVAVSLGEIGDVSAIPALREMAEEFPEERVWAGYGLVVLEEPEGFAIHEDVALSNERWTIRRHAVEMLGKTMDRRSTPILLNSLNDNQVDVRISAVRALAEVGDPEALPALGASLDDHEVATVNTPTTVAEEAEKAIAAIESNSRD
jgi:HEAT repeat protein